MRFFTVNPCKALSGAVKYYWVLDSNGTSANLSSRAFPDGFTGMVCIDGRSERIEQFDAETMNLALPLNFIFGQRKAYVDFLCSGFMGLVAVSFTPLGLHQVLGGMPTYLLRDNHFTLPDLWGNEGQVLDERLVNAHDPYEKIALIERFLLNQLRGNRTAGVLCAQVALNELFRSNGQASMLRLCSITGYSERYLYQQFKATIGLPPHRLALILRLQHALRLMETQRLTLTEVAYEAGFYDQAHFTKMFKAYSGETPSTFMQRIPGVENLRY